MFTLFPACCSQQIHKHTAHVHLNVKWAGNELNVIIGGYAAGQVTPPGTEWGRTFLGLCLCVCARVCVCVSVCFWGGVKALSLPHVFFGKNHVCQSSPFAVGSVTHAVWDGSCFCAREILFSSFAPLWYSDPWENEVVSRCCVILAFQS